MTTGTVAGADRLETLTATTFSLFVLQGRGPTVVEFMSYGCEHCRALEPIIQEVAAMLFAQEAFYRVNVAVETDLANTYDIKRTPTLISFLNGQEIGRVEGPEPSTKSVFDAVTAPFSK